MNTLQEVISVAGLGVLEFVFQNTSEEGSLPDVLCFRCPKILSVLRLCSGGRKASVDFICLPPVISAAKNEPSVKDKSQHLNIPNYQGGTHFCCHSEAGTNPDTLSIWWTRCQQISRQAVPRQRQPRGRLQKTVLCLPCPPASSSRCCWLSLCFRARKGKARGLKNRTEYLSSVAGQGIVGRLGVTFH